MIRLWIVSVWVALLLVMAPSFWIFVFTGHWQAAIAFVTGMAYLFFNIYSFNSPQLYETSI